MMMKICTLLRKGGVYSYFLNYYVTRNYSAIPKRFYRKAGILYDDGTYEITLDERKLKTPRGNILKMRNKPLAFAVAAEWDSQKDYIHRSTMHLTALCNTSIDNPTNMTKYECIEKILNFLDSDTILYHSSNDEQLYKFQMVEWGSLIDWFNKEFGVSLKSTTNISFPPIEKETKSCLSRYLHSYNLECIFGFAYAIDNLKSLILTVCCVHRKLDLKKAVLISRLEEEYQVGNWGRIEWAHGINHLDLQARVAAAILYIHLNSASEEVLTKIPRN